MRARNARSYSAEDMKAILGLKESSPMPSLPTMGQGPKVSGSDDEDERPGLGAPGTEAGAATKQEDDLGIFTVTSTTSLADYFKKKQLEMQQINMSAAREPEEIVQPEPEAPQNRKRKRDRMASSEEEEAAAESKKAESAESSSEEKVHKDKKKKDKKEKKDKKDKRDRDDKKDKRDKKRKDKKEKKSKSD
jgi:hypothetical protein